MKTKLMLLFSGLVLLSLWQTVLAQSIRLVHTFTSCGVLNAQQFIADVAVFKVRGDFFSYCFYDIREHKLHTVHFKEIAGFERPPSATGKELWKLYNEGKMWQYDEIIPIFWDGTRQKVSFGVRKVSYTYKAAGAPWCVGSNEKAEYWESQERWYCPKEKKVLDTNEYLDKVAETLLYTIDLQQKKLIQIQKIPTTNSTFIGTSGRALVWQQPIYYEENGRAHHTPGKLIVGFAEPAGAKTEYTINIPMREKQNFNTLHYSIDSSVSPDGKIILATEYDESVKGERGYLLNPPAQGFIIYLATGETKQINIPLAAYGIFYDADYHRLVLGSNQTGKLHAYDLTSGKQTLSVMSGRSLFFISSTPDGTKLLVFNHRGAEVHDRKTLKKIKRIPLSDMLPDAQKMIVSDTFFVSTDGKTLIMNKMQYQDDYVISDLDNPGFHVFEVKD